MSAACLSLEPYTLWNHRLLCLLDAFEQEDDSICWKQWKTGMVKRPFKHFPLKVKGFLHLQFQTSVKLLMSIYVTWTWFRWSTNTFKKDCCFDRSGDCAIHSAMAGATMVTHQIVPFYIIVCTHHVYTIWNTYDIKWIEIQDDTGTNTQWYKYDQLCMYRIVQTYYGYTYIDTHEDMGKCRNAGGMKPESEIATTLDALAF